jgi:hypothetical protein
MPRKSNKDEDGKKKKLASKEPQKKRAGGRRDDEDDDIPRRDNTNYGKSISFQELLNGFNSPGVIFALNEEGLYNKLDTIVNTYKGITMSETAGLRELQLKTTFNKWEIINDYYKK